MSRSIALTTSSHKLRDSNSLEHESVPPLFKVGFSVYQEQNTALEAHCSVSSSGLSVKNTECWDVVRLQLGWFISQACPNDVEMTSFIRVLLSRTISSISFFPVLLISLRKERGTSIAKGTSFRMYSAYGAAIRKSVPSESPTVFEMGLPRVRQRWTIRVATLVSFSALTRKCSSCLIYSDSSVKSISRRSGRSRLSTLCS
jgi:hypothetical protein